MNKNLIIIAVSAILVLLLILKFVRRDNINSGDDAVYGPKGTDDLPAPNVFDFSKATKLIDSAKNLVSISTEERFAKNLISEIKKLLKGHGDKPLYKGGGPFTGTFLLNNWRAMLNKDKLAGLLNVYNKPQVILRVLIHYPQYKKYYINKLLPAGVQQGNPILILADKLIKKFLPQLEQIIFKTTDSQKIDRIIKKLISQFGPNSKLTKEDFGDLVLVQRTSKLLDSVYKVLVKELENDKVETFENNDEMYPGYSENTYAEFQN